MTELAETIFRYNERDNVRVPKLNRMLQHLVIVENTLIESAASTTTAEAGENLGGHRAVRIEDDGLAYYADPDATARFTIGMTTGAVTAGAVATIQLDGEVEEASWSWLDNEVVWLGPDGTLTQTPPSTGVAFQVAVPMGPTKLRIQPQLMATLA